MELTKQAHAYMLTPTQVRLEWPCYGLWEAVWRNQVFPPWFAPHVVPFPQKRYTITLADDNNDKNVEKTYIPDTVLMFFAGNPTVVSALTLQDTEPLPLATTAQYSLMPHLTADLLIHEAKPGPIPAASPDSQREVLIEQLEQARKQVFGQVQLYFAQNPTAMVVVAVATAGSVYQWAVFINECTLPATKLADQTYIPSPERNMHEVNELPQVPFAKIHETFQKKLAMQMTSSPTPDPPKRARTEAPEPLQPSPVILPTRSERAANRAAISSSNATANAAAGPSSSGASGGQDGDGSGKPNNSPRYFMPEWSKPYDWHCEAEAAVQSKKEFIDSFSEFYPKIFAYARERFEGHAI